MAAVDAPVDCHPAAGMRFGMAQASTGTGTPSTSSCSSTFSSPRAFQQLSRTPSPPTFRSSAGRTKLTLPLERKPRAAVAAPGLCAAIERLLPPPGLPLPAMPPSPPTQSSQPTPRTQKFCSAFGGAACEMAAVAADSTVDEGILISIGSENHPHACAGACRYVKRKGGCKDGAQCRKCHLCFWRRAGDDEEPEPSEAPVLSIGTRGHPTHCGNACRYVRRKGGCRDGANCTKCHACLWQRDATDATPATTASPSSPSVASPSMASPSAAVLPSPRTMSVPVPSPPPLPVGLTMERPKLRSMLPPPPPPPGLPGLPGTSADTQRTFGEAGNRLEALIFAALSTC